MNKKPLIGIASCFFDIPKRPNVLGSYRTYVESVQKAGGTPIILPPNPKSISTYAKLIDGLVLTGGDDIHPKFFGEKLPKMKLTLSPDQRTHFELKLVKYFLKKKKPILAICLGCQTLNISLGGKLIQDLPTQRPNTHEHRNGSHKVWVDSTSKLKKITGKNEFLVNSRHHQALGKIGKQLKVTAVSPDGVIESIEVLGHPFALGVQWHPEISPKQKESIQVFRAFIKSCG